MKPALTIKDFQSIAPSKLKILENYGFHRCPEEEMTKSTFCRVAYAGKNVGFIFSFDLRDQVVDVAVVKVHKRKFQDNSQGGYSSGIFTHLVKYANFRGRPGKSKRKGKWEAPSLDVQIDSCLELLLGYGQSLLGDSASSLPV